MSECYAPMFKPAPFISLARYQCFNEAGSVYDVMRWHIVISSGVFSLGGIGPWPNKSVLEIGKNWLPPCLINDIL